MLTNDHVNMWHATDNTWPFPNYSDAIRSFLSDVSIIWSFVWFNCTGLPCCHLIVAKSQCCEALIKFRQLNFHYQAHRPAGTSKQLLQHHFGISPALVTQGHCKVTWSWSIMWPKHPPPTAHPLPPFPELPAPPLATIYQSATTRQILNNSYGLPSRTTGRIWWSFRSLSTVSFIVISL